LQNEAFCEPLYNIKMDKILKKHVCRRVVFELSTVVVKNNAVTSRTGVGGFVEDNEGR